MGHWVRIAAAFAVAGCSSANDSAGGTSDHTVDASAIFQGSASIRGLVALPAPSSGRGIQLHVTSTATGARAGDFVGPAGTTAGTTVAYEITGLAPGQYVLQMRVDQSNDGVVGGSGDFDGYTGGTVKSPVVDRSMATPISVGAGGASGVDFGLAITP
ncbi:MAG: hypothetical protein JWM74_2674 [Myxococcaceae bacterium]|jgi:hypothetical protein|nr:hypothetical protein [Myxococcaceae bacterium]